MGGKAHNTTKYKKKMQICHKKTDKKWKSHNFVKDIKGKIHNVDTDKIENSQF